MTIKVIFYGVWCNKEQVVESYHDTLKEAQERAEEYCQIEGGTYHVIEGRSLGWVEPQTAPVLWHHNED